MFSHVASCYLLTIINKDSFFRAWPPHVLSFFGLLVEFLLTHMEVFLIALKQIFFRNWRLCCAILSVVSSYRINRRKKFLIVMLAIY